VPDAPFGAAGRFVQDEEPAEALGGQVEASAGRAHGSSLVAKLPDVMEIARVYRWRLAAYIHVTLSGPGRVLRRSVPANLGHDDLVISAALAARLDAMDCQVRTGQGNY
jgi:hypothetical protein